MAQVLSVGPEQVEDEVDQARIGPSAILQKVKTRDAAVVKGAYLAVNDELLRVHLPARGGDSLEVSCPVLRAPTEQPKVASGAHGEDAIAVELELVDVIGGVRRNLLNEGRQLHGPNALAQVF